MAKKKETKQEKEAETIQKEEIVEEKYPLIELVLACPVDHVWVFYNLSRVGLLEQYERETHEYGVKDIEPSLTIKEFNKIINGE